MIARSPRRQDFYAVAPNICGSSVWNLHHVTNLAPGNFEVASRFLENLCTSGLEVW